MLKQIGDIVKSIVWIILEHVTRIRPGRVYLESHGGISYSCNPKYISEYLLSHKSDKYQLIWSFDNPDQIDIKSDNILKVKKHTVKEWFYLATSEFIISNIRFCHWTNWKKRKGQKYIMTWHGAYPLKRIEFDAVDKLPQSYLKIMKEDSKRIDLMFSPSEMFTTLIGKAFRYHGFILNNADPRTDIFRDAKKVVNAKKKVYAHFDIQSDEKIVLYAPTFRADKSTSCYILEWDGIMNAFKRCEEGKYRLFIRMHPSMRDSVDYISRLRYNFFVDATDYDDMQELLCAADVLITDYSSTMFEIAMMQKPCYLFVPDKDTYDRGFYVSLNDLPFPICPDIQSLINMINNFNPNIYNMKVISMFEDMFKQYPIGNSCALLLDWMEQKSLKKELSI